MVVGLPGTGISGLFYIILAAVMPVRELFRMVSGQGTTLLRWRCILLQVWNAAGITGGLWLMGWLVTRTVQEVAVSTGGAGARAIEVMPKNVVSGPGAHLALITLVCVVGAIEILSFVMGRIWGKAIVPRRYRAGGPA